MLAAAHCAEAYATTIQETFRSSVHLETTECHVPVWRSDTCCPPWIAERLGWRLEASPGGINHLAVIL